MKTPNPMDVIATITISLHANHAMDISGNIGDKKLALAMLDHAKDAVKNQLRPEDDKSIIISGRDTEIMQHPNYPTKPLGDM